MWVYLLIMASASALVSGLAPAGWSEPLLGLATQLPWFIGVHVVVCALAPVAMAAHRISPLHWAGLAVRHAGAARSRTEHVSPAALRPDRRADHS